ncbi:MAG TPA: PilZ domain-containing protein [Phycisphaerae bacterium]|nr:PilZ domain-containing protein [Phycisphaerae bacterium]
MARTKPPTMQHPVAGEGAEIRAATVADDAPAGSGRPPEATTGFQEIPPPWIRNKRQSASGVGVRRQRRHEWEASVAVELDESGPTGVTRRRVRVMTRDLSATGFAFVFDRAIAPGTHVRARFDALPATPSVEGRVRHCLPCAGKPHFIIGVEITEAEPAR